MVQIEEINVNGVKAQGILIKEPGGATHPNMIIIEAEKGYLMCGYLNLDAAEKFGDAAVLVGGASFTAVLANSIKGATSYAYHLGVKDGMSGAEALKCLVD